MILLLDDDPAMRKLVARLLSREGYEIREASDDAGAMGELTAEKVDLVLINLSAADAGEKAVHTLRTAHAELPIVVLSEGLRESSENLFVLPKLSRPVAVVSFIAQTLEEMADRAGVYR
jgi:DNA-binding response OmpR family regulator